MKKYKVQFSDKMARIAELDMIEIDLKEEDDKKIENTKNEGNYTV